MTIASFYSSQKSGWACCHRQDGARAEWEVQHLTYSSCGLKINLSTKSRNSFPCLRLYMTKLHSVLPDINLKLRADAVRMNSDVRDLHDHWAECNLPQHFLAWTFLCLSGSCLLSFVSHTERHLPIKAHFQLMTVFKHPILKGPSSLIAFQSAPFISCPFEQSSANMCYQWRYFWRHIFDGVLKKQYLCVAVWCA